MKDVHLQASYRVSTELFKDSMLEHEEILKEARNNVLQALTGKVMEKLVVSNNPHYREYRVDLYVATPEVFWKCVDEEVKKVIDKRFYGKV